MVNHIDSDFYKMKFISLPTKNKALELVRETLPFLDIERGPWVAGGAARKIAQNCQLGWSDIDVFFPSKESFDWVKKYFEDKKIMSMLDVPVAGHEATPRGHIVKLADRATSIDSEFHVLNLQFSGKRFFFSTEELFDDFDFTVCMFATDGERMVCADTSIEDVKAKRLIISNPNKKPKRPKAARLAKYCEQGFTPGPGVIKAMLGVDCPVFYADEYLNSDEY